MSTHKELAKNLYSQINELVNRFQKEHRVIVIGSIDNISTAGTMGRISYTDISITCQSEDGSEIGIWSSKRAGEERFEKMIKR